MRARTSPVLEAEESMVVSVNGRSRRDVVDDEYAVSPLAESLNRARADEGNGFPLFDSRDADELRPRVAMGGRKLATGGGGAAIMSLSPKSLSS